MDYDHVSVKKGKECNVGKKTVAPIEMRTPKYEHSMRQMKYQIRDYRT
jgi:hypothetical protein